MERKYTILISLFFLFTVFTEDSFSQEKKRQISFQGGMYYGSGYGWLSNEFVDTEGIISGLGGRLHFNIFKHFRAGIMGNSATLNYENNSYLKVTTFGLTAEAYLVTGRFNLALGAYGGMCINRNLHVFSKNGSYLNADFKKKSLGFISPMITVSFQLTQKISLAIISDYLYSPLFSDKNDFSLVNARFGIFFNR
jgi:hypothetical protein